MQRMFCCETSNCTLCTCALEYFELLNSHVQPCEIISSVELNCVAPGLNSSTVFIGLLMDGVSSVLMLNSSVTVHPDPVFYTWLQPLEFSSSVEQILLNITVSMNDVCS